jgi:hypothetical protein
MSGAGCERSEPTVISKNEAQNGHGIEQAANIHAEQYVSRRQCPWLRRRRGPKHLQDNDSSLDVTSCGRNGRDRTKGRKGRHKSHWEQNNQNGEN